MTGGSSTNEPALTSQRVVYGRVALSAVLDRVDSGELPKVGHVVAVAFAAGAAVGTRPVALPSTEPWSNHPASTPHAPRPRPRATMTRPASASRTPRCLRRRRGGSERRLVAIA